MTASAVTCANAFDFLGCDRNALDTSPLVRVLAALRDERIARSFSLASEFLRALQPVRSPISFLYVYAWRAFSANRGS